MKVQGVNLAIKVHGHRIMALDEAEAGGKVITQQ